MYLFVRTRSMTLESNFFLHNSYPICLTRPVHVFLINSEKDYVDDYFIKHPEHHSV